MGKNKENFIIRGGFIQDIYKFEIIPTMQKYYSEIYDKNGTIKLGSVSIFNI